MERSDVRETWAVTLRHLAATQFYLPEHLPMGEARVTERELAHYLHHNEFELALDEADALVELCSAPASYWREMQQAAASMGLVEEAARYAQRSES